MSRFVAYLALLLLLGGCGDPSKPSKQAERVCQRLSQHLRQAESSEELQELQLELKRDFCEMAELLIELDRKRALGEQLPPLSSRVLEELREELERVYSLEEGREIIERAQGEALRRLDRAVSRYR